MARKKTPIRFALGLEVFAFLIVIVSMCSSCASVEKMTQFDSTPNAGRGRGTMGTMIEANRQSALQRMEVGAVGSILGVSKVEREPADRKGSRKSWNIVFGERIIEGDRLVTERSRLHIQFKDHTDIEMGESSVLLVDRIRFGAPNPLPQLTSQDQFDETVFRFEQGLVHFIANEVNAKERFLVKTPNGIMRLIGPTDLFVIQLSGIKDVTIKVIRGSVEVLNIITNERLTVEQGNGAVLKSTGVISAQGAVSNEMVNFLTSRTRI